MDNTYREIQAIIAESRRVTAEMAKRAGTANHSSPSARAAMDKFADILNRSQSIDSISLDELIKAAGS